MNREAFRYGLILAHALLAQAARMDDYRGGLITPPLPKPRFILTDTSGRPFDFPQGQRAMSRCCSSVTHIAPISVRCTWQTWVPR